LARGVNAEFTNPDEMMKFEIRELETDILKRKKIPYRGFPDNNRFVISEI
jgi:hypothetical protein